MQKYILLLAFLATVACRDKGGDRKHKHEDPLALIDKHLSHSLAYHYMWPWSQLFKAAAALEFEEAFEDPQILSDSQKFRVNLHVKRFKPEELRIKVKNRYIIVEGKRKGKSDEQPFLTNHFIQRFVMPPGSLQEEVTAVLKENGILCVTVPKHDPPPEREVPIEVILSTKVTEKPEIPEKKPITTEKIETSTEKIEVPALLEQSSSSAPLEQLESVEATTHVGKIRKKELKTTTKTAKDNEVSKGLDNNGLDYALIEQEE